MTAGYLWFYSIILPLQPKVIPNAICGICQRGKEANKKGKPEALIHCSQCDNSGKFTLLISKDWPHLNSVCFDFSFPHLFNWRSDHSNAYNWQSCLVIHRESQLSIVSSHAFVLSL